MRVRSPLNCNQGKFKIRGAKQLSVLSKLLKSKGEMKGNMFEGLFFACSTTLANLQGDNRFREAKKHSRETSLNGIRIQTQICLTAEDWHFPKILLTDIVWFIISQVSRQSPVSQEDKSYTEVVHT